MHKHTDQDTFFRSHSCGDLSEKDNGERVTLNGWIHRIRNHGSVIFFDLRDRYGMTQVIVSDTADASLQNIAATLHVEYCVAVRGIVNLRPQDMINSHIPTGAIEIDAEQLHVFSTSDVPPFAIEESSQAHEETRLRYRYLDLRSTRMRQHMELRHTVTSSVRTFLSERKFLEIETPTLIRTTPEGARDFVVPSRLHPGSFYALPQSPQLYKQLLMISGFDKYFQIARCYRDEDARGDRQPEHTQIDIEMSFVQQEHVFSLIEEMMQYVCERSMSQALPSSFPIISYEDAMNRFGSDKPDLRFDLPLHDITKEVSQSTFEVFRSVAKAGGSIKAIVLPHATHISRKHISAWEDVAKTYGAKGLAWCRCSAAPEGSDTPLLLEGGIAKFLEPLSPQLFSTLPLQKDSLLLFVADKWYTACTALGAVRNAVAQECTLIPQNNTLHFAWITDFPLFEWNDHTQKWDAAHHIFTAPKDAYIDSIEKNPAGVKSNSYDLVCNGVELASGSIRIHDPVLQQRIFNIIGLDKEEADKRFGFFLEALKYGAPPHGGIAPGLDRILMLMSGESSIREVIAFPKTTRAESPLDGAPSPIEDLQLQELHIRPQLP